MNKKQAISKRQNRNKAEKNYQENNFQLKLIKSRKNKEIPFK